MSTPDLPPDEPSRLLPTTTRDNGRGGQLRNGNPGNRGGRGRAKRRLIVAAGKDLGRELARLRKAADPSHDVTCPDCGRVFKADVVRGMDARTRIAYAQLLAGLEASGKGEDEPPVDIVVATGSAADVRDAAREGVTGVELVTGQPQLAPAKPDSGPPERTQSASAPE